MKHFGSLIFFFLLLSCAVEKEIAVEDSSTSLLTVVFEESASSTKTSLEGMNVVWNKGDQISVFDYTSLLYEQLLVPYVYTVHDECDGSKYGVFDVTYPEKPEYAVYPVKEYNYSSNFPYVNWSLPSKQEYRKNSFGPGSNAAIGKIDGGKMVMYNLCGLIKLQLTGSEKISLIKITSAKQEFLWGEAKTNVQFEGGNPSFEFSGESSPDNQTLTLLCPDGVELSSQEPTSFIFALPAGTLSEGFTVTVYNDNGEDMQIKGAGSGANTIRRSIILTMPSVEFKAGSIAEISGNKLDILQNASNFEIPMLSGNPGQAAILWGDGSSGAYYYGISHQYQSAGNHQVTVQTEGASGCTFSTLNGVVSLDFTNF